MEIFSKLFEKLTKHKKKMLLDKEKKEETDFREGVKVKPKEEKRYSFYYDTILREFKETGRLCLYTWKNVSEEEIPETYKFDKKSTYYRKEVNIENPDDIVYSQLVISRLGRMYYYKAINPEDGEKHSSAYSNADIMLQLDGTDKSEIFNRSLTKEELIQLVKKINIEKENAKYNFAYQVKYSEEDEGLKLLDKKHIISNFLIGIDKREDEELMCVEDENISIKTNDNGDLIVSLDGKEEIITSKQLDSITLPNIGNSLGGFTPNAIRVILGVEKDKERDER